VKSFAADPRWKEALAADRKRYRSLVGSIADRKAVGAKEPPNEAAVARAIAGLLDEDAIVSFDGGQIMEWAHTFIPTREPDRHLFNPGMGHLGFGQPFANAAKLAHRDRQVVNVAGDGGFGCTVQELETAARYGLDVINIVCNDSAWGMYRPMEQLFGNARMGTRLTSVDFSKVGQGFGCYGERVTKLSDLPAAFARAKASRRPAVLDVPVTFTPHPMDRLWGEIVFAGVDLPAAAASGAKAA
jgi:acetolactate synthase I/II/III large subunit